MIYFDANATTPLCKEAKDAMLNCFLLGPINSSSSHSQGQMAKKKLVEARAHVAKFLKVTPDEIIFTSGGTESMNLLIKSLLPMGKALTTEIEHPCVHNTLIHCKRVKVGELGQPKPEDIEAAIDDEITSLVFSAVNTETGALLDLEAVSHIALKYNLPLIIDGVGLLGKAPFLIPKGVTGMGFSGHKIHGPQGAGFCYIKSGAKKFGSFQTGGPQEKNWRGGTENLAAILGLAAALYERPSSYLEELRDSFEKEVLQTIPNAQVNAIGPRISNTSNLYFEGIDGESLLILLDQKGLMASHGSACSSGALEPSRTLLGMGYSKKRASGSIRFSFHYQNTIEEVRLACQILRDCYGSISQAMR
jgi:cysteine desulfurase